MAAVVHFAILSLAQLRFRYICGANAGLNQFPPPQFDEVLSRPRSAGGVPHWNAARRGLWARA